LECADGSYCTGMTKNLRRVLAEANIIRKGRFSLPNKFPAKVVFQEFQVPFREAMVKIQYLKEMTKRVKIKLIETKKWPNAKVLKEYFEYRNKNLTNTVSKDYYINTTPLISGDSTSN